MSKIQSLIKETLNEMEIDDFTKEIDKNTEIFGTKGALDSLGLVEFLVSLEQKIETAYDTSLTIADEKAMSQKNSPFRTVNSLSNFLEIRLADNE